MPPSKIFPSANAIFAIRRQQGQGLPATRNLIKLLGMTISPKHASAMSSLGIEVGAGTISEQRSQKEHFMPDVTFQGHLRVGNMLNFLCMSGYEPLLVGTDPTSPVTTTLNGAISSRHAKVATLTSITGISVGDWLQISALATPGVPAVSDTVEVHKVVSVGATNDVQKITLNASGGTWTYSFGGQTTAALAYNITASALQTAIQGLSSVGSGNMTVAATTGGFNVTGAGTLAATNLALATVDGTNLTGTGAYVAITKVTEGAGAAQVAFEGRLLYTYADLTAVKKVDNAKANTAYFKHVQPDSPLEGDLYTLYFRLANSDKTVEGIFFDIAGSSFSPNLQTGNIATVSADLKALDVSRYPADMFTAFSTLMADPSGVTVNNTRGNFTILGNTVDGPQNMSFTLNAELYEDVVLTKYQKQSNVHIGHTLSSTTAGKFIKDYFDQVIYGGANNYTVSDAIPEAAFNYTAQSAKTISIGVNYAFGIVAPDCQLAGYDPQVNTNQPVMGNFEMLKIVPNESTGNEDWYMFATTKLTTDHFSAA